MISTHSLIIHSQVQVPTLVCNSILGVLVLKDWEVDLHMASCFPAGMSAMTWTPGSS